jgi:hypothetical protein
MIKSTNTSCHGKSTVSSVCVYFLDFCPEGFLLNILIPRQITPSTPVPLATAQRFPQHLFDLLNLLDLLDLLDLWDLLDILYILETYILLDRDNVEGGTSF